MHSKPDNPEKDCPAFFIMKIKQTRRRFTLDTDLEDFEGDQVKCRNGEISFYKTRFKTIEDCDLWMKIKVNGMKTQYKSQFNIKQGRADIQETDWELIKRFSPDARDGIISKEDFVVFRDYLAYNLIDKDVERFPPDVLQRFAETIVGKQKLGSKDTGGHDWSTYGIGRYFKSEIEKQNIDEGLAALGGYVPSEKKRQKQKDVAQQDNGLLWLVAYYYVPTHLQKEIKDIGAGLTNSSIGFIGTKTRNVNDKDGNFLYREYVLTDALEAVEGSLVGVESQSGAGAKEFVPNENNSVENTEEINMEVKFTLKAVDVEKSVNSESLDVDLKELQMSLEDEVGKAIDSLNTKIIELEDQAKTLTADKEKAEKKVEPYHEAMVQEALKFGRLAELINDENVKDRKDLFKSMTFDELSERLDTYKSVYNKLNPPKSITDANNEDGKDEKEIEYNHAPDTAFQQL